MRACREGRRPARNKRRLPNKYSSYPDTPGGRPDPTRDLPARPQTTPSTSRGMLRSAASIGHGEMRRMAAVLGGAAADDAADPSSSSPPSPARSLGFAKRRPHTREGAGARDRGHDRGQDWGPGRDRGSDRLQRGGRGGGEGGRDALERKSGRATTAGATGSRRARRVDWGLSGSASPGEFGPSSPAAVVGRRSSSNRTRSQNLSNRGTRGNRGNRGSSPFAPAGNERRAGGGQAGSGQAEGGRAGEGRAGEGRAFIGSRDSGTRDSGSSSSSSSSSSSNALVPVCGTNERAWTSWLGGGQVCVVCVCE
jgi:hypothetical protein